MHTENKYLSKDRDFTKEILSLIETHPLDAELETMLDEYHPFDLAKALMELDQGIQATLLTHFELDFSASIIEHFEEEDAIAILKRIPKEHAVKIVDRMETDDAVDLLKYLEIEDEEFDLLSLLSPRKRAELNKLLVYSDNEIGSAMSASYLKLTESMSVKEAMKKVVSTAGDTDYISIIYVVKSNKLVGYLKLKTLIVARADEKIKDIMETRLIYAHPTDDKEEVAHLMQDYGNSSLPIVDENMHLVGILTHDDLMDIVASERSEDYAKFAGLIDGEIDLERDTLVDSVKQRLPWLSLLLLLSMLTTLIMSLFEGDMTFSEGAIQLSTKLAIYLPLILDMSGNAGTQSLAVMIRYLTTSKKELAKKAIRKYLLREIGTGIVQGVSIGILIVIIIIVSNWIISGTLFEYRSVVTALVTGTAVMVALMVSTLLGALIPLVLNKFKIDPVVASGPFITTIADIITLTLYYSISLAILLPLYA
ncbi:MAG: magnesium transporter [Candidatus Izemoplasmatales bacterium]|jgi:magnesium transporter